ncbi:hypothetical protein ACJOV8_015010 [Formosa sp. 3Alg 14/1]|uniref:hypothetical protein n=1 Tax=unclassified Formosa TaxID=2644710 RepID=UPI0039BE6F02
MKTSQSLNYILVVFGILVAMYAKVDDSENTYLLILGICSLLYGAFKISQTIPSKTEKEDEINTEDE